MKLYDLETCPYCKMVRDKLGELKLDFERVAVPRDRAARQEVFDVSGQWTVPVLVDGDVTLDDEEKILPYLEEKYGQKVG